jgi:molybdopterin-synthase adenylyltransferase
VRDEQVRRYARHILLPDVGGLGQTALLTSSVRVEFRESEPDAELIAASYLAAGGTGTLVVHGASEAQLATIASHGVDTKLVTDPATTATPAMPVDEIPLQPKPPWWPAAAGDDIALAFWRGGLAATRWMASVANK